MFYRYTVVILKYITAYEYDIHDLEVLEALSKQSEGWSLPKTTSIAVPEAPRWLWREPEGTGKETAGTIGAASTSIFAGSTSQERRTLCMLFLFFYQLISEGLNCFLCIYRNF